MGASAFIDTNVLVYAYDRAEPEKQARALDVLDRLAHAGLGAISTQVLSEFFVTVTGKISAPLVIPEACLRLDNFLRIWKVLDLTGMVVLEAGRGVRDHRFNYWDALVWATARLNQIPLVLSEDFSDRAVVEGVRFVNPFDGDFRRADWLG